jgi:hypothetical protein
MFGPRKTSFGVSIAFPFSGTGLLMLLVIGAFSGILRFCEYVMGQDAIALSSAMVVVFALAALAYLARCLLVTAESSAEGYDLAPPLPNPIEAEELIAAFLGLLSLSFFAFGPLILVRILGLEAPWATYPAVAVGAAYLPMGILGHAVRGDMSGTLPVRILPAIFAGMHRYFPSIILTAAAGFLVLAARDGALVRLPTFMLFAADVVAGWLLFAAVHRAGVVHRECNAVRLLLPVPTPAVSVEECAVPHRPLSEIERALLEREKENSSH